MYHIYIIDHIQNCHINSSFASNKIFIRWWPWVQAWFWGTITTNPGYTSSISQYYQTLLDGVCSVQMPYSLRCSYSLVLNFFMYSLFSAGKSPSLVKNAKVEFKIKSWHPISIGNMSVDQSFLTHCSHRSLYFSNFCWCAQSMLTLKGFVNSAMITFFELTDQMMRSGCWRVDVISVGKASCQSTSVITCQSVQPSSKVGLCLFLCGVFETFPSLTNCIIVFIHEISLAVSPHIFAISAIIPKISFCLHV